MTYPMSAYNFIVEIDGLNTIAFTEVSGLSASVDVVELRDGSSPESFPVKMPGLSKVSNVVLKRGITKGNNDFFNWFQSSREKTDRRNVAIKLLDEEKNTMMVWLLTNAFPATIQYTGLQALSSEAALEELELAYESLRVETA